MPESICSCSPLITTHPLSPSRPPPHLLVSRSTVMLGVSHMVCTEDAGAGITLEWQKIYKNGLDCKFKGKLTRLSFPLAKGCYSGRKNSTQFAAQFTVSLTTPPGLRAPPSGHCQLQGPPSPPHLQSPVPAARPRPPRAPPLTQALTARLGTVSPEVRKLHRRSVRSLPRGRSKR